jgi:hypothetical protein
MQSKSSEEIKNAYDINNVERGLTDGNGFTNGFAAKNAPRETVIRNGDAQAQLELNTYKTGLTNGNGLTISEGVTNGNGLTNGNGVSNVNGNGKPNRIPLVKSKRLKKRLMGIVVAVFLVLAPLSIYMIDIPEASDSIVIDGDFRDWEGVLRHTDSLGDMSQHPNVNIIETSIAVQNDKASVLMVVDGWIMEGGSDGRTDQISIMLDSDSDASTGYSYSGIGADYRIHAYGKDGRVEGGTVYIFDKYYKSTEKRENTDWNAWNPANNGYIEISGNKLEASVLLYKDTYYSDRPMYAVFQTQEYTGFSDRTDVVSTNPGHLAIHQSPAVTDDIVESTSKLQFLRLIASAHESPITLESLKLDRNSDVTVSISPRLPITLRAGESRELMVSLDTSALRATSVVNIELKDVLAFTSFMSEPATVPVTISGEGYTGYVGSAPDRIVIDGAFGDWAGVKGYPDNIEDSTIEGNTNIDIREHRTVEASNALSFFVRVDGKMMQGTELLMEPISVVEKDLRGGSSDPTSIVMTVKEPVINGQDYAYFMLDLDNNQFTGFNMKNQIGAEYMLRLVGQSGEIQTSELYEYYDDSPAMKPDGMGSLIKNRELSNDVWVKVADIDSACDSKRLETQVLSKYLNNNDLSNIDYYILMTDWSEGFDFTVDPYLGGLGGTGTVTIIKMDENTAHQEPKSSNSRNPMDTRASSRALIANGNKAGANVIPANLDTMQGEYWNINKFEIAAGVTVNIISGTLLVIKAAHIYINGTLNGNAGGISGGTGGTGGGGNGGPGGGLAAIDGNGTGGLGTTATGSGGDGGGGGGYGGAGGNGGAGGGAGTGGGATGGSTHGSKTSMYIAMGRGGGGGGGGTNILGSGGTGGAGGAGIWLQSTTNMSITGSVTANGNVGGVGLPGINNNEHGAGGGGGGSGGGVLIKLDSTTNALVINTATITANAGNGGNGGAYNGGAGGDGGGGGGGGGGGRIKIFFNSTFTNTSNTFQVNAGTGGTGGAGNPAGSSGLGGTAGTMYVIPEFTMIAIPITFTMLIFLGMRRKITGGRARTKHAESGSEGEVIL